MQRRLPARYIQLILRSYRDCTEKEERRKRKRRQDVNGERRGEGAR